MKKLEEKKAQANPQLIKAVPAKVEGQGSVWNNNSYHWEQKSVDAWSTDTLKKTMSLFYFKMDKATLRITEVKDLTGEASVSIRKGKKIVTYEYKCKLVWECDMADDTNSKVIGTIGGEYEMPEISNDVISDGDEWDIECRIQKGDEALRKTLY
jgi:activator of HSP90 ATPase